MNLQPELSDKAMVTEMVSYMEYKRLPLTPCGLKLPFLHLPSDS